MSLARKNRKPKLGAGYYESNPWDTTQDALRLLGVVKGIDFCRRDPVSSVP